MDDRKGKGVMEHGSNDSPLQTARRARERRAAVRAMARAAEAPCAGEDSNPSGHNAPPGDVLRLGGSTASSRLELQGQQARRDSGIRSSPPPMACPVCRYDVFYNNTTICTVCACAEAVRIACAFPIPDHQRCSACRTYPGWTVDEPLRHVCRCAVCRFFRGAVCPVCISALGYRPPQPRHQQHLGPLHPDITRIFLSMPVRSSSSIWQGQPTAMGSSASAVRVPRTAGPPPPPASSGITAAFDRHSGQRIESSSTWKGQPTAMGDSASAARVLPAAVPPPPPASASGITAAIDGHSGRVESSPSIRSWDSTHSTPEYDDLTCPSCLHNTAPMLPKPELHVCHCDSCIKVGEVCPVCASEAG